MVVYDPETVVDSVKGAVVAIPEGLGVRKEVVVKDVDLEYVPEAVPDSVKGAVVGIADAETVFNPDSVKAAVVGIADAETVTAERVKAAVVGIAD